MTISLDGMDLPDLVMENEFSQNRVEARVKRTLGGVPNIWEQKNSEKNIDLVGGRDFGWISRDDLTRLHNLAAEANAFYTLSYDGTEYTVRFRPEDGAPGRGDAGLSPVRIRRTGIGIARSGSG